MIHLQSLLTGKATAIVDGYGCNGNLYVSAINRLQNLFGNPKRIVNAFLEKLPNFKAQDPAYTESNTQFFSFLLKMVDTFSQLGFIHDLHSTTNPNVALAKLPNLNVALAKLPNPVRLEWNKFVLEKNHQQPSPQTLSEWLLNFFKACNDLSSINHVTQNIFKTHGKSTFLADIITLPMLRKIVTRGNYRSNASDYLMSEKKQTAIKPCPSNENCQFLYKCTHFQSLPPSFRRDHIKKLNLFFNCFGSQQVHLKKYLP